MMTAIHFASAWRLFCLLPSAAARGITLLLSLGVACPAPLYLAPTKPSAPLSRMNLTTSTNLTDWSINSTRLPYLHRAAFGGGAFMVVTDDGQLGQTIDGSACETDRKETNL